MDYKLVVERKELSRSFLVSVFVTFLLCMVAVAVWKYSLDKRGIQWKSHSSYYSSKGRIFAANESKNRIDTVFLVIHYGQNSGSGIGECRLGEFGH